MKTVFIYALNDPETGRIRYIGKSNNLKERIRMHLKDKKHTHKCHWIQSLLARDLKPRLQILAEVSEDRWQMWERGYIEIFRNAGYDLVNGTDGGDGVCLTGPKNPMFGKHLSQEHKDKLSRATKGIPKSPETRLKMSVNRRGMKFSDSHRANIRFARLGKPTSEKTKAKLRAYQAARKASLCP